MAKLSDLFKDLLPYLLQGLLGGIAFASFWKDWEDYGKKLGRLRWVLLVATIGVFILTLADTHVSRRDAYVKDYTNAGRIRTLTEQIELERDENKQNSDGFRTSFAHLNDKYSDLAAKVQNADLLRELHKTQKDLTDTQDKLSQPKAKLTAGFWDPDMLLTDIEQEITVSKKADGSISLNLIVINPGDVAALTGTYTIRICEGCRYSREPEGLVHYSGAQEQDRGATFERILQKTADVKHTIEIIPPAHPGPFPNRIEVDVIYACVNCVTTTIPMWVNIR